jgi:hypothetical protein
LVRPGAWRCTAEEKLRLVAQPQRPKRPQHGPDQRAQDEAALGEIRAITHARAAYGHRRVTALLKRARRKVQDARPTQDSMLLNLAAKKGATQPSQNCAQPRVENLLFVPIMTNT